MSEEEVRIEDMIEDLSNLVAVPKIKIAAFGEPGAGKTTFAGTFPKLLLLDVDAGALPLYGKPVHRIKVEHTDVLTEVYEMLLENPGMYESVAIDTVSELQMLHLAELSQTSYDKDSKGTRDPYLVDIDDYGRNTQWLRRMVRAYRNLDMNVCMITHEVEIQDADKVIRKRPALTPKFAGNFLGYFDIVGYLRVNHETQDREMIIKPTRHLRAKYRIVGADTGKVEIPDSIVNPSFESLMDVAFPDWRNIDAEAKAKAKKVKARKAKVKKSKKRKKD